MQVAPPTCGASVSGASKARRVYIICGAGAAAGLCSPTQPAALPRTRTPTRAACCAAAAVAAVAADGRPTILVAEKLGAGGVDMLKEVGNVDLSYNLSKEELCAKISLCDALIVRSATKVRATVVGWHAGGGGGGMCIAMSVCSSVRQGACKLGPFVRIACMLRLAASLPDTKVYITHSSALALFAKGGLPSSPTNWPTPICNRRSPAR